MVMRDMPDRLHQDPEITRLHWELAQCRAKLAQTRSELTELKTLYRAQKRPYQYWQKVMNSLPVCISYLDHDCRYCYVNHSYQRWFGFSPDEIYGKRLMDVIGQPAYQLVKPYIDRVLTGETVTYETTIPYTQGGSRHIRATLIPDINENKIIQGYYALIVDLSDRHQLERDLQESKQKYQTLFEILPIGVSITDAAGNLLEANPASEQILGISANEHTQRTYDSPTWKIIRPDGSPMPPEDYPSVRALQEQRSIHAIEQGIVRENGSVQWIMTSATPIPLERYGVAITYMNITDRKRLENDLQSANNLYNFVIQSIGEGIWDWDIVTNQVSLSERYWTILGHSLSQAPAWIDQTCVKASIHPDDQAEWEAALSAHLECQKRYDLELRFQHQQGHYIWLRSRGQAIRDEHDRPIRMVGTIEDITDRKAVETALNQREQEFRTLAENSPDCIMRCDREFRFLYVNPTVTKLTGIPGQLFINKTSQDMNFPDHLTDLWHNAMIVAFSTGQRQFLEYEIQLEDGLRTFQSWVVPELQVAQVSQETYRNQSNQPHNPISSVLIVAREISNLKKAQNALAQQAERERTLRLISQHIQQSLDLDQILSAAVTEVQRIFQGDRTLIYRFEDYATGVIIQEVTNPNYPYALEMAGELPFCCPDCCVTDTQYQTQVISDKDLEAGHEHPVQLMRTMGIKSMAIAPITQSQADGQCRAWGFLMVHHCATHRHWETDEVDLLQQIGDQLAIAIQHSELLEKFRSQAEQLSQANQFLEEINVRLNELSNRDGLTQIANRRCFDVVLQQEWKRFQRTQEPLSLILFDVDFFKQYNDLHGHPAGDDCLIQIARTVEGLLKRKTDLVARYGGEEFVVILPHTDAMGACQVAELIRQSVLDLQLPHSHVNGCQRYVTVSLGIASQVANRCQSPQSLIDGADRALYQAKSQGRNTWVLAGVNHLPSEHHCCCQPEID